MALDGNIKFMYRGANADLGGGALAKWSRDTNLDGHYIQSVGNGSDADLTQRGAANHNHTDAGSHTPTINTHRHNSSAGTSTGTIMVAEGPDGMPDNSTHSHPSKAGEYKVATMQSASITVNNSTDNDPPYTTVIFIKSDGTADGIPDQCDAFFASDTLPTNWIRVCGNTYPKGAGTGADGGGTGGATSHSHTSPSHTHTQNAHNHTASNSSASSSKFTLEANAGTRASQFGHTHDLTWANATLTMTAVTTTINSTTTEPVYKKINMIHNDNGAESLPDGIIGVWTSTNASIPTNWAQYEHGVNFIKCANGAGESGVTTGGEATHTHTASSCQPTMRGHTHTLTAGSASQNDGSSGSDLTVSSLTHTHTWTCSSTTPTTVAASITISSCSSEANYPLYKRIILIKYTTPVSASHLLASMGVGG